ncbi:MAG: LptA/OstA family protein [Alphaproteobacteria bacterium]
MTRALFFSSIYPMRALGLGAAVWVLAATAAPAQQQSPGFVNQQSDAPIEIEADQGIEWQQDTKQYIARGNVQAKQGDMTLFADQVVAQYREAKTEGTEIYRLEATGNVQIASPNQNAWADHGVYDVDRGVMTLTGEVRLGSPEDNAYAYGDKGEYDTKQGVLVLTGHNLRFSSPNVDIAAKQSLEYWEKKRIAVARGGAVATQNDRKLTADIMQAYISEAPPPETKPSSSPPSSTATPDKAPIARGAKSPTKPPAPGGKPSGATPGGGIDRIQAWGGVEIVTPREIARAERGDYNVVAGVAHLEKNVRITQGQNTLNGESAEVNLNTSIHRIVSGTGGDAPRVRAIISPQKSQPTQPQTITPQAPKPQAAPSIPATKPK